MGITEADVLITEALASRPARPPDLAAENQALRTLAQHLTDEPEALLKTLVQIAIALCQADTAGVSLLETEASGESNFRWVAIAGTLEAAEGGTTPATFSPCGTTLACDHPQLYAYPERYFTYLAHPQLAIVEGLLIPLRINNRALGTLWIISHQESRHFDAEDQRLMTSLAGFTASALDSMQQLQQKATIALRQSEQFNQQILNSSNDCIKVLDLEGRILFMSPGGQALMDIQDIAPLLQTSWVEFWQASEQPTAIEAIAKARAGEVCSIQGYCPTLSGEPKWWDNKISPMRGADGQVERLLCISRDITGQVRIEHERRRTEARLRESEERLSAIFSEAAVGLSEISLDGQFQRVNDQLCRMLGRSREALLAASVPDVTHPDDVARSLEAFRAIMQTGQPVSFDKRYLRSDGTIVWANSSLTRLDDEQGCPHMVLAVTVDLSDRKQAELALRESESRLRLMIESAKDYAIFSLDLNGIITSWNSGAERLLGYSEAEAIGCGGDMIFTPEDLEQNQAELERQTTLSQGRAEDQRWHVRQDGSRFWANGLMMPLQNESGDIQGFVKILRDETAQRQANERFQLLYDTTSDLLATEQPLALMHNLFHKLSVQLDLHCYYNFLLEEKDNRSLLHLRNYEGIAEESAKTIEWLELDEYICGLAVQQRRQIVLNQAQIATHPNAQVARATGMSAYACQPLIAQGRVLGSLSFGSLTRTSFTPEEIHLLQSTCDQIAIAIDRANLIASIQQQAEQLQQANRIKDEFLAVLSHELRSPLNPILGWSKLLQGGKLDETKTAQALATIERNAKLQSELIEDLLDVSRILQGKLSLNASEVNLASIITSAIETVRLAAAAKSIQVQTNLAPTISSAWGDATRLQQVVWNLLSNAVKFTPVGGQIAVRLVQRDQQAQITVSDNGKGIAAEFLPYVFDYFRQADSTTTRKFGGLGLGLAIVRHLVELHGGTVQVESPGEGQGATFTVRLPLLATTLKTNQDERLPQQPSDLQGIKILVVDDQADAREFVAFLLEQQGAQVMMATSAHEALSVLSQAKPDVLVSDIGMPDMDGYMLIQQVRALTPEQGRHIPAIALTAYARDPDQQQALNAGFQQHLSKPVEPQALVRTVIALVQKDRSAS
ncbi:MAG: PAS domain S-box protein [Leptolyngbyaceae cyanobacterium bins.349]|nr:PAS domain S-box protein [Leptolyngbyaceae cyanobacterium bins.349]